MIAASLADIARSTGFAVSTVSRALRNSGEIPLATQKKIKEAARQLNYRPNPLLASLARARFAPQRDDGIPIAYFHLPVDPSYEPVVRGLIQANQDHARKLGYRLEPFLPTDFRDGAQATRILYSRGFQGIILPSNFRFDMLPGMDWNRFSLAGWGETIMDPANPLSSLVNHATVDHFRLVLSAWNEVLKKGYRRVGFVLLNVSCIDDQFRLGAAQICLQNISPPDRIPPFFFELNPDPLSTEQLAKWVRHYRPDAIIGFNGMIRWALKHEGFRIPEDVAFAALHKDVSSEHVQVSEVHSGMKHMRLEAMFAAIELLDQQIRHREFGLVSTCRIQVIQSRWIDGDSLPAVRRRR